MSLNCLKNSGTNAEHDEAIVLNPSFQLPWVNGSQLLLILLMAHTLSPASFLWQPKIDGELALNSADKREEIDITLQ